MRLSSVFIRLAHGRTCTSEWKPKIQSPKRVNRLIRQPPDRADDDRPARGVKARRALHWRTIVAFHEELDLLPKVAGKSMFRNKIPETLVPDRLCNG
jgi:hypothetical protein